MIKSFSYLGSKVSMKIKIEKLIFEGFGLGREIGSRSFDSSQNFLQSKPVFVRKSVPGDELEVRITKNKKTFAEAVITKIIKPSKDRIAPRCGVFFQCGGCEHSNMSYAKQTEWKERIFAETLQRQGLNLQLEKIIPGSSSEFFYRNSIRFFFIQEENKNIAFARHNFQYNKGYFGIEKCYLQSETCNTILKTLKDFINKNVEDKSLFWQLKIREGKFTNEFMVEIITSGEILPKQNEIVEVLRSITNIKSIYHTITPGKSLRNLRRRLIYGSPVIHEKIGRFKFEISPESFFQTNSLGIKTLYDCIKKMTGINAGDNILDLYCGTGTIGIYLSTLAKKVTGVEIVPEAIRDANDNAKINHIYNCEFICLDVEKYLNNNSKKFDVIIVDPPRAGLAKNIIKILAKTNSRIVYVSCNPATFARDIKLFESFNCKLSRVQPIDMFPQTHHIECVGLIK